MAERNELQENGYATFPSLIPERLVRDLRKALSPKIEERREPSAAGEIYEKFLEGEDWPKETGILLKALLVSRPSTAKPLAH